MSDLTETPEHIAKKSILWEIYHELFTNKIKKAWRNFVKYLRTSLFVIIQPSKFFDDNKRRDLYDCVQYTVNTLGITTLFVLIFSVFGLNADNGLIEDSDPAKQLINTITQLTGIVFYLISLSVYLWIAKKFKGMYRDLPKESMSIGFIYYYNFLFFVGVISIVLLSFINPDFNIKTFIDDQGNEMIFGIMALIGMIFAFYFFSRMGRIKNILLYVIFVLFIASGIVLNAFSLFPIMFG